MDNVRRLFVTYPRPVLVLLVGYAVCLLAGTYTHVKDLLVHGFLAAPVPMAVGFYWNALALFDPLAVWLLWRRPKWGILLTIAIISSDISINTSVYLAGYFGPSIPHLVPLSLFEQSLFGLFVFVTGPIANQLLSRPK